MQWYTRREGVVRGPFSAENISKYILLGRIQLNDELSNDQQHWQEAGLISSVIPTAITHLTSWGDYHLYVEARMSADERVIERRDSLITNYGSDRQNRRRQTDRRSKELLTLIGMSIHEHIRSGYRHQYRSSKLRTLLLAALLASLIFAWLVPVAR
jgi:hypothetical protein